LKQIYLTFKTWLAKDINNRLLAILILAFLIRLGFVLALNPNGYYFSDTRHYDKAAKALLAGEGFGEKYYRAPLYPVMMAGVYFVFGKSFLAMRLLEAFLGTGLCWLVFLIAKGLLDESIALIAALLSALFPHFVLLAGILYPTQVFAILLAASFFFLLQSEKANQFTKVTLSGGLAALAALTVPAIFFVIPFWLLWLVFRSRKSIRRNLVLSLVFLLALAVALAPWTLRNYHKYARVTLVQPLPHTVLPNLQDQQAQEQEVESGFQGTVKYLKENPTGTEEDSIIRTALHYLLHPWGTLRHTISEMGHFWALYPDRLDTANPTYRQTIHAKDGRMITDGSRLWPLVKIISILVMSLVYTFACIGLFTTTLTKQHLTFVLLTIAGFSIGYSLIYAEVRYRIPIEPYVLIFTAAGLSYLAKRILARR